MIYLDSAATTQPYPEVALGMIDYLTKYYQNPAALYALDGQEAKAVEEARAAVAKLIACKPEEIYFTSGGAEADNWAFKMAAFTYKRLGKTIITTKTEHHAVTGTCEWLAKQGFNIVYLPVKYHVGSVDPEDLRQALEANPDTILVSIMTTNNETGCVNNIHDLCKIAHEHHALFHTDAVQAIHYELVSVAFTGVDMLSMSAHKWHGPKGVGALYIRNGIKLDPWLHGGSQERHRRGSTHNVPGIVGMGIAAQILEKEKWDIDNKMRAQQKLLWDKIHEYCPNAWYLGEDRNDLTKNYSPAILNVVFPDMPATGKELVEYLRDYGVMCSTGSACNADMINPSEVLMECGLTPDEALRAVRFSLTCDTEDWELYEAANAVREFYSAFDIPEKV